MENTDAITTQSQLAELRQYFGVEAMTDDKKLTIRVNKAVWSRACVNSKLKGYGSLQEYIRKCIVELNDWQEEAEKSKVILEARQRG